MFLVEDDKRPSYLVAIPAFAGDCFNLLEYLAYDNMMDIINKFSYNIIPNLHVNMFDLKKLSLNLIKSQNLVFVLLIE
jgi:hypothetical protein